jgi:hypothetical protein
VSNDEVIIGTSFFVQWDDLELRGGFEWRNDGWDIFPFTLDLAIGKRLANEKEEQGSDRQT